MNSKLLTSLLLSPLLAACTTKPVLPYAEPGPDTPTANLRVITNSNVDGAPYLGCLGDKWKMAEAGRFAHGKNNINYPQFPTSPSKIDMAPRFAPKLPGYLGAIRMAAGTYEEVAPEYRVPADKPFLIQTLGLAAGTYGSTYYTCPPMNRVYQFEAGKSYEAYVGIKAGISDQGEQLLCVFNVYQLLTKEGLDFSLPAPLNSELPSAVSCSE